MGCLTAAALKGSIRAAMRAVAAFILSSSSYEEQYRFREWRVSSCESLIARCYTKRREPCQSSEV